MTECRAKLNGIQGRWLWWVALMAITLLGAWLRLMGLNVRPLWLDEIHTFQVVNEAAGPLDMIRTWWNGFMVSDPPLYYLLCYPFAGADLYSPHWKMRLVGLICGVLCAPLMAAGVRRLSGSCVVGLLAGFLMAINTFAIEYSQEYRPYGLLLFVSLVYAYAQGAIIEGFTWRRWIMLVLAALALLYTHYFGGFVLAAGYLVWGVMLFLTRYRDEAGRWKGFLALPVLLGICFIPMFVYGYNQSRHFSGQGGGGASDAMLQMYLAKKEHTNYWSDLPYILNAYYNAPYRTTVHWLQALALVGVVAAFWHQWRRAAGVALATVLFVALCYAFYEVMKYPYEPRRSLSALLGLIYFQAWGLYAPVLAWRRWAPGRPIWGWIAAGGLTALVAVFFLSQHRHYHAAGYRNQVRQADWPAMAEFVNRKAAHGDVVASFSRAGETWVSSQYGFYHRRTRSALPYHLVSDLPALQRLLDDPAVRGVWFVVCYPMTGQEELFGHLLGYGHWKPFFGGTMVYVAADEYPAGRKQETAFALKDGFHALHLQGHPPGTTATVKLQWPSSCELLYTGRNDQLTALPFVEGVQFMEIDPGSDAADAATTAALYPLVSPGRWNAAMEFSEMQPGNIHVDAVLDDEFAPAFQMRNNGTVIYRFWLAEGGPYRLHLKGKNDAPGPIGMRVFSSSAGELEPIAFDRADNSYSVLTRSLHMQAGLNEIRFYYNSFRRIEATGRNTSDSYNELILSRWMLEKVISGGGEQ